MAYVVKDDDDLYVCGAGLDGRGDLVIWWDVDQRTATRFASIALAQNLVDIAREPSPGDNAGRHARIVRLRPRKVCT